jgi:hypothetical protein
MTGRIRFGLQGAQAGNEVALADIAKLTYSESDIDHLIIEELAFGDGMFSRFMERIGIEDATLSTLRHSVYENFSSGASKDAWGETDIFLEFNAPAGTPRNLLIENKVTAGFQQDQAVRYRRRAEHHSSTGVSSMTALIAPEIYLTSVPEADWDRMLSYADIAACITDQSRLSQWRREVLLNAGSRAARLSTFANSQRAPQRSLH